MKQDRLVSRLPFFVFNCQGSRHHPADYADKVLLAESHRHRVYGVGLRFGLDGHLRQVLRPNTGKALLRLSEENCPIVLSKIWKNNFQVLAR